MLAINAAPPSDYLVADKGYDSNALRSWLIERGTTPVIPSKSNRKVQIEHKTEFVGRILVPTEKNRTFKNGKIKITETKLYPGYVFVEMKLEDDGRIPQDVFFLIKETTGVGDFVGTPRPTPLELHEVEKIQMSSRAPEEEPEVRMNFEKGEHVTIKEGPFEGYEGSVDELLPEKGLVRVLVTIFGRQAPIEIEEWKLAKADEA